MKTEIYHPFEVAIFPRLTGPESLYFAVNSGKVFNFYNPLNYRNVTCDRDGPNLPRLPFKLTASTSSSSSVQAGTYPLIFPIESSWTKIYIYLFCSFLPPKNWVPGPSFIPFIDKAWIVYKNNSGTIIGETKNKEVAHIKYQTYKSGGEGYKGNAINYSPIASIEKSENDEWIVNQFLTDDLPITTLFDSSSFELHNTEMYKLTTGGDIMVQMKQQVSEILGIPTTNTLKGYIRADARLSLPLVEPFNNEVDIINRLGFENISPFLPLSAPASDGPPKRTYTEPNRDYPRPAVPTGIRIFN